MRAPIKVLPSDIAEKIAAGEVIERPASVVKELVENSIDAGSQHIQVKLYDGGRRSIVIQDDGHGIPADEVKLALMRHATSKLKSVDDLFNLSSLGFRGEALPSIATVSRFTLESKTQTSHHAVYLEGGALLQESSGDSTSPLNGQTTGTLIKVEDLFYNIPARLKFLRSKSSESGYIRELIERIALVYPHIEFQLYSDDRRALWLKRCSGITERFAQIVDLKPPANHDTEFYSDHIETFHTQFDTLVVDGWLERNRRASTSKDIFVTVNGRMVRDKLLHQAIVTGLRHRMMEGEFPKIFLRVQIDPALVDVNVHPAKSEVRFHDSRAVFQVIQGALNELGSRPNKLYYESPLPSSTQPSTALDTAPTLTLGMQPDAPASTIATPHTPRAYQAPLLTNQRTQLQTKDFDVWQSRATTTTNKATTTPTTTSSRPESQATANAFKYHYIGQLNKTYLLFQDDNALVLIDQHAAHERINYEKLKSRLLNDGLKPQTLLVSALVKLNPTDLALALDHAPFFNKLGFEFEIFGDTSLVLRSVPDIVSNSEYNTSQQELFLSVLEDIKSNAGDDFIQQDLLRIAPKLERFIATMACHASVRAGQALSQTEAVKLVETMENTPSSLNCPHGRPASIRLSQSQIEGLFKR